MTYPLSIYAESDLRSNRLRFEDPLPSNIGKYGGQFRRKLRFLTQSNTPDRDYGRWCGGRFISPL
jgi:hypothetical protein